MSMPTCPTCKYAKGVCGKTGVPIRYSTGCTYHEPKPKQTNADRIRGMTDEKLAEKIAEMIDCSVCKSLHHSESNECPSHPHQACADFWLDWLKAPADKEGEG